MQFADQYESWVDDIAVPLASAPELQVPVELGFYNQKTGVKAANPGTPDNLTRDIQGDWVRKTGGRGFLVNEPLVETKISFDENGRFGYSISTTSVRQTSTDISCTVSRSSGGNYKVIDDTVVLYPSSIRIYASNDCLKRNPSMFTGEIDAKGPTTLTVSFKTSSAGGKVTTMLRVCNEREYGMFEDPDLFQGCIAELIKQ